MSPTIGGDESFSIYYWLFDAYKKIFHLLSRKVTIIDISSQTHGYNYLSFISKGKNIYGKMKFESGAHSIPLIDSKG